MSTPCDLDELKHQVREKAIAELKEYIEKDGAWSELAAGFGLLTVRSNCGRFSADTMLARSYSLYSLSYKGVEFWSHFYSNSYEPPPKDETQEAIESLMYDLHTKAFNWARNRKDCARYAKALGIEGHEWHPPGSIVEMEPYTIVDLPDTHKINWVVVGGLFLLGIIIGVILL